MHHHPDTANRAGNARIACATARAMLSRLVGSGDAQTLLDHAERHRALASALRGDLEHANVLLYPLTPELEAQARARIEEHEAEAAAIEAGVAARLAVP